MFGKKHKTLSFDRTMLKPTIKSSICNGEKVAGFVNVETGKFSDVMLVKTEADVDEFCKQYAIDRKDLQKIY